MDHNEAIHLMAAEKYLLGELSPDLRDQFEEHYFGCQECALDLRAGSVLLAHGKTVLAEQEQRAIAPAARKAKSGGMFAWLRPAVWGPVMALLLVVVGYQNLVTYPKLRGAVSNVNTPALLASASLLKADTRGIDRQVVSAHKDEPFLLYLDVPADSRFSSYEAELRGPSGMVEWNLKFSSETAKDTLPIRVPPTKEGAGIYTLVLNGVDGSSQRKSEVGRYPFELKNQD